MTQINYQRGYNDTKLCASFITSKVQLKIEFLDWNNKYKHIPDTGTIMPSSVQWMEKAIFPL